ncbi:NADH dehydrogenase [ubiquinone] flavoprotein 3, mitochondrial isoform X2 [Aquila chrysaetos chrysaetos]|uniref:NADH dehydrogenase [ubiquinone] flavoprotein 3, mitochondrial isoform X2 n=1 Tax=Aquila chrysaetos chrysaetos TaxID=223781 RepID=UPI0005D0AFE8|nr:NADH dehydrogenase [ubiquinone] flavoprotein 3, mitochondrial isoform X2 [Aquila chrysaetos chrysaetos]
MAAPSLLGCGRAATREVLRLEARGLRGAAPSAALCTKPVGSRTPPTNVVAPQGSAKLLAIKAPVEFPKMLSSSSLLVSANKETTAAAEPAPEEFDNSTYKNLQHHEYNIYTFVDSVVVLSKFRQPQPSSGRPSPRH